jgi:hypothetical protein
VDLVQVYDVGLQAPEALLALALHGVLVEDVGDVALLVPHERALGEDEGTVGLRDAFQGLRHEFLGVPEAVDGGRVHPVDTELDGPPYGPHRLVVVLRSPRRGPTAPAYSPGPEAYGRDLHPRLAEPHRLQDSLLLSRQLSAISFQLFVLADS